MSKPGLRCSLPLAAVLVCLGLAIPCFGDSQARIVRLSDIHGDVLIDRNAGQGFEKAFLNLPITQGMKVRTGTDGRAELEFEDSSTLRITPGSDIAVTELSLRDSGEKVSSVNLLQGTVYVNFNGGKEKDKGEALRLTFARETLTLTRSAHLRVEVGDTDATVAVFQGAVEITGASGTVEVGKNQTASFDLADADRHSLAKSIDEDPYDSWDKQQNQYQRLYQDNSYSSYSPYAYGTSDLNYYGNFFSLPGYGMLWQPYFVGAGWDPFMNGAWAFGPGFGYGWVSSYPWGWTPYHYGSWAFISPYGWVWEPGGAWMGGNTLPVFVNAPVTFIPPRTPVIP